MEVLFWYWYVLQMHWLVPRPMFHAGWLLAVCRIWRSCRKRHSVWSATTSRARLILKRSVVWSTSRDPLLLFDQRILSSLPRSTSCLPCPVSWLAGSIGSNAVCQLMRSFFAPVLVKPRTWTNIAWHVFSVVVLSVWKFHLLLDYTSLSRIFSLNIK